VERFRDLIHRLDALECYDPRIEQSDLTVPAIVVVIDEVSGCALDIRSCESDSLDLRVRVLLADRVALLIPLLGVSWARLLGIVAPVLAHKDVALFTH
jgi:hypothetical protein